MLFAVERQGQRDTRALGTAPLFEAIAGPFLNTDEARSSESFSVKPHECTEAFQKIPRAKCISLAT